MRAHVSFMIILARLFSRGIPLLHGSRFLLLPQGDSPKQFLINLANIPLTAEEVHDDTACEACTQLLVCAMEHMDVTPQPQGKTRGRAAHDPARTGTPAQVRTICNCVAMPLSAMPVLRLEVLLCIVATAAR